MQKKIGSQFSGDAYIEVSDHTNWLPIEDLLKK